ncbi:protein tyrosine phosphatase [Cupriavidus sp. USMAA2-4]|uniref:protein-tyrosine-phosphatase n=1 Tax=Cupriavidus malaysiensis TaxID=367825 RepID=A0ABM6F9I2_9BURK|nr:MULTISPECIES: low molecular weight protein-tyrosine-phosphatase [Cupriavidus]AOY95147.1 protein tyrosine phosphatase [Cupriavidus sp. USMAA2-4]AOZ01955.1 protein tyrosine phosphatase [Cupriavidus sp. USMAHM13]AOZ08308.1 protein tyrosine phosphatase [Cupriavidus malaysiensis]
MIRSILVVCLGNRCRSPMAAALLRRSLPACQVISAGIAPAVGALVDPRAGRLLALEGIAMDEHRAQRLNAAMVDFADLILVMEAQQMEMVEQSFPAAHGRTFRLCESLDLDVPDPYGGTHGLFLLAFSLIRQGVDSWAGKIAGDASPAGFRETS